MTSCLQTMFCNAKSQRLVEMFAIPSPRGAVKSLHRLLVKHGTLPGHSRRTDLFFAHVGHAELGYEIVSVDFRSH